MENPFTASINSAASGGGNNSNENPLLGVPASLVDKVNPMLTKRLAGEIGNNVIGTSIGLSPSPTPVGVASAFASISGSSPGMVNAALQFPQPTPITAAPVPGVPIALYRQASVEATVSTIEDNPISSPVKPQQAPQSFVEPVLIVDLADSSPSRISQPTGSRDCPPSSSRKRKSNPATSAAVNDELNMNTDSMEQSQDFKRVNNKLESPTPEKGK